MGTMAERPEERLIEFLTDSLGDDLRAVYRDDAGDLVALWPPDRRARAPAEDAVLDRCLGAARHLRGRTSGSTPAPSSDADGLVGLVGDRVVVWLPAGRAGGFVVTADRQPDHPMTAFVESCLAALR